jgi:AraC family transcriptional regulator
MSALTPRFENGRAMLMAGLRAFHEFDTAAQTIPEQWGKFAGMGNIPDQTGTTAYGLTCQAIREKQMMEYMTGVEVSSFDNLPTDIGRMRVPEAWYAVFSHPGYISTIQDTWMFIWEQWLPNTDHQPANTPDFERYDESFDPEQPGGVEIWIPLVRKH